jgi:glucokinase
MAPVGQGATATIGVDLGGSKIAAGLVGDAGTVLERRLVATSASQGANSVLTRLVGLIGDLQERARDKGVEVQGAGVATAGLVDPERGVLAASTDALAGFGGLRLREQLEQLVSLRVAVVNDVQAMALGEQRFGVGGEGNDVLYVAVGTGVGGALTRAGVLVLGAHGFAGDIGHVLVDASDGARRCPCGRPGHLEAYVSGPALASTYERCGGAGPLGGDLRPVAVRAAAGEGLAREVLREGASLLGRAVGGVVNLLDPDLVVFGGGLLDLGDDLFWAHAHERLLGEVRGPAVTRVEHAWLGKDAAVVGAAIAALK